MNNKQKLNLWLLVLFGIGSMIGGGIFNSPTDLINVANPQAVMISWLIGGSGVVFLALIFQMLANRRPELKGGIFTYAKAGFGDFMGFNSAWGYWISSWLGNVAFFILLFKTLGDLVGNIPPIIAFILASLILWTIFFIESKGSQNVGKINAVVTVGKLIPLGFVVLLGIGAFKANIFNVPDWTNTLASAGEVTKTTLMAQIKGAMGSILWCFVGVEAATVLSEKAESPKIVGKATVISLFITLGIYMMISVISMGVISAPELSKAVTPLAVVLSKTFIGNAGAVLVKLGLVVSLIGALISWLMLAAEIPYVASKGGVMPKWFSKTNKNDSPINALLVTTVLTQLFLLSLLSNKLQDAYFIVFNIATTTILIPYLFSALYAAKVCKEDKLGIKHKLIALIGTLYSVYVIYAVGIIYVGFAIIMYWTGTLIYIRSKKENGKNLNKYEKIFMGIISIVAIIMIILMILGKVTP